MEDRIERYIRSGHSGLCIVSLEERRVEAELKRAAEKLGYGLYSWSVTEGLADALGGGALAGHDPLEAIEAVAGLPEQSLVLMRDLHLQLEDGDPVLLRAVRETLARCKTESKALVVCGCRDTLPPELKREFVRIEPPLPDRAVLAAVLAGICASADIELPEGDQADALLEAAAGLTCAEAENAFALSIVECGAVDPATVAREKAHAVGSGGILEVCSASGTLDDIGGLELLKDWLRKRREAFSRRAVEYGLPTPRGLLILGVPGTGKSLTAKATADVLGRPLLRLDAGRIYGGIVGESERNLRTAIGTAEAIAPCVLWIDEIEKGFGGSRSSGATDGGTSGRVFGSFISWMQEKTAPVFIVATANDVSRLPPEMLRKGRWDELWFVDLPESSEREDIWRIQIARHGRDPKQYRLDALAAATEGYTGAEIEAVMRDGLYEAFADGGEPSTVGLAAIAAATVPLSRLRSESVEQLRSWAKGRARRASGPAKGLAA